jgi:NitT/TauT family transport system permease protein
MKASTIFLKILKGALIAALWLGVWYLLALIVGKELFLPYPHIVARRLFELCRTAPFWKTVGVSLFRILEGFALGTALGFALAIATHYIRPLRAFFAPAVRAVRATPVVSFILLAYLWLDNNTIPVVIALLMVLPIIWENMTAGLESLDPSLHEMARVYKLPRHRELMKITLPALAPHFYSGALTSLGLAWKSGIAAEVISYPKIAIGKSMNDAKLVLDTAEVLAWTVVVVLLSLSFEWLFKLLFKRRKRK